MQLLFKRLHARAGNHNLVSSLAVHNLKTALFVHVKLALFTALKLKRHRMGNYLETGSHTFDEDAENIRPDMDEDAIDMPQHNNLMSTSTSSIEVATEAGESLDFHIFSYKQHMGFKKRQVFRWAAAKLALTEELIRNNQLRNVHLQQNTYLEPETAYLSDDEMEEVSLHQQLHSLENYRTELVQLLGRLSLDQRPKSKKKKSKKSKRRKLMSKHCNKNAEHERDINSDVWDSSKVASVNVCCDQITKRAPLKVKNC